MPIAALTGDPVEVGLVQSLAHPGGNIYRRQRRHRPVPLWKAHRAATRNATRLSKLAFLTLRVEWEGIQGRRCARLPMRRALLSMFRCSTSCYREAAWRGHREKFARGRECRHGR